MSNGLCLKHVPQQQDAEIRVTVTLRIPMAIFLEELADRDTLLSQAGGIFRKKCI